MVRGKGDGGNQTNGKKYGNGEEIKRGKGRKARKSIRRWEGRADNA